MLQQVQTRKPGERIEVCVEREETSVPTNRHRRDQRVEAGRGDAATPEKVHHTGRFEVIVLIGEYSRKALETGMEMIELPLIAHAGQNFLKHHAGDEERKTLPNERGETRDYVGR